MMTIRFQKLCQTRPRRLVLIIGMLVSAVLVVHTFTLSTRKALSHSFPMVNTPELEIRNPLSKGSSSKSMRVGKFNLLSDSETSRDIVVKEVTETEVSDMEGEKDINKNKIKVMDEDAVNNEDPDDDFDLDEDGDPDNEFSFKLGDGFILKKTRDPIGGFITLEKVTAPLTVTLPEMGGDSRSGVPVALEDVSQTDTSLTIEKIRISYNDSLAPPLVSPPLVSYDTKSHIKVNFNMNSSSPVVSVESNFPPPDQPAAESLLKSENSVQLQSSLPTSNDKSTVPSIILMKKKKRGRPPTSISEMNQILLKNRASYRSMRPRWSSARDQQILAAKAQIENARIVKTDRQLYAPVFRNLSMFKRSYELMEKTLKVYVYPEGQKPIFHQPLLKGIYASEGWFMKLMEGNRRFVVRDPRKAHLFYMPFSSRFLEFALYVPGSHNRSNLREYLQNYVNMIAAKHPFWNRTGGADHFLVACHDWAPYETRHTMDRSIKALCNADVSDVFRLGTDVSLPETYVRSSRNPLKDLGGRPANMRPTLAFFAGNMHGRLRPILLQYWENKDSDMKIYGPMPPGVKSKMTYIQHMKTSKYCICPRGYEVNSPRVVEAIFYECIPVIISDNYVLPFFEVLNWESFSVLVAEKDIPILKDILLAIPEEKYLSLQMGVRKVQQHFLWHSKPVKYDLFHMILHSIWFNRVFQIRPR